MLPLQARADLRAKAMNKCSAFPKAPALHIQDTRWTGGFSLSWDELCIFQAQPTGMVFYCSYIYSLIGWKLKPVKLSLWIYFSGEHYPTLCHISWLFTCFTRSCRTAIVKACKKSSDETVSIVISSTEMLTREGFHRAFQELFEQYNNALQPEEITSKDTRTSCVYYQ